MRILFITAGVPSPIGQIHVLDLLKMLSGKHESSVISCDLGESYLDDPELRTVADLTRVPLARKGILQRGIRSLLTLTPVAVLGYRDPAIRDAIVTALTRRDYDVVIFEQLVMGQYGELTGNRAKVLFPVDAVSRLKWQWFRNVRDPLRKIVFAVDYWITKRYERRIYRQFDGVMFVSSADANYALTNHQVGGSKVFVLPLAVDTHYFTPIESDDRGSPSLAFLGNMFNSINEDAVLWFHRAVWGRLKQQVPHLKLLVVGNDPSSEIKALGESDRNVVVTGFLHDIRPPIQGATVFISPLRVGTGIKNRILQAMAMGKAIIASPAAIEGIGVTDGVHLLLAHSADDWVKQSLFLLGNLGERERLGRQAREFAEKKYSLQTKTSRFIEIAKEAKGEKNAI